MRKPYRNEGVIVTVWDGARVVWRRPMLAGRAYSEVTALTARGYDVSISNLKPPPRVAYYQGNRRAVAQRELFTFP